MATETQVIIKVLREVAGDNVIETFKDEFGSRLITHKVIYIMQELGLKVGGRFSWYLNGPYSPALTKLMYDNVVDCPQTIEQTDSLRLSEKGKQLVDKAKEFFTGEFFMYNLEKYQWYELLASARFLSKEYRCQNSERLIELLKQYKPQYTDGQIKFAVNSFILKEKLFN